MSGGCAPQRWTAQALVVVMLLLVACGAEAPPRTVRSQPAPAQPPTSAPEPVTLPTLSIAATALPAAPAADSAAPADDPRGLGDPNAPITVVEYSDFQ